MEKAAWIDKCVLHMTELSITSVKLGQLAEALWPHLGSVDRPKSLKQSRRARSSGAWCLARKEGCGQEAKRLARAGPACSDGYIAICKAT